MIEWRHSYALDAKANEDAIWRKDLRPLLDDLPSNVLEIWAYGSTEMINNAIDHSSGKELNLSLEKSSTGASMVITDDGDGVFRKIQRQFDLEDERHAILELSKGKLTTDPARHTGEGIFFTSRAFDRFEILSGKLRFSHSCTLGANGLDSIEETQDFHQGTSVVLVLDNYSARVLRHVFNDFTSGEDRGFTKTVVPVRLALYGDEMLIARSQAKRLLAHMDRFKTIVLDFHGIHDIGQAFADEVFRVFKRQHPDISLTAINTSEGVAQMIRRAENHG